MSLLADIANAPTEITFRGVTYPLRELNALECGMHSRWLEKRAFDAISRQTQLPEDVRRRLERAVLIDAAAGTFDFGSEAYIASLVTIHGMAHIVHLCLKDSHPEATFDFCVEMVTEKTAQKVMADLEAMQKAAGAETEPGNSSGPGDSSPGPQTSSESSATPPSAGDSVYP